MNEQGTHSAALDSTPPKTISPGAAIRSARQAAGIHIEALAVALKVPVSKLEALEEDNFQALPDAVFARALASSVCRSLKLDPLDILALMPPSSAPRLAAESVEINATFQNGRGKFGNTALFARLRRPVLLAASILLLGAALLAFYPRSTPFGGTEGGSEKDPKMLVLPADQPQAANPQVELDAAGADSSKPMAIDGGGGSPDVVIPMPQLSGSVPTMPPETRVDPMESKEALLVLRARAESWVQVRNSAGVAIFEKILGNGESAVVPASPPLSIVIGNAAATEVVIRGKVMDLVPVSKDNVARFEVPQ